MNREEIHSGLLALADPNYRTFHAKLCPGCDNILGIRIPVLKDYAKQLKKQYKSMREYLDCPFWDYAEDIMLFGFLLAGEKMTDQERLPYLQIYVSHITSWAVCDSPVSSYKFIGKNPDFYKPVIRSYLTSDKEYEVRFAVVALMDYYINDAEIDGVLSDIAGLAHDGYYVKMAAAWALSVAYIRFPEKVLPMFSAKILDAFTHNKAIQKICESYRVSAEDKAMLRTLKK